MGTGSGSRGRAAGLGTAGLVVTVAGVFANGLAYGVPVLGARHLVPADLSALATLMALGAIGGVASTGLQIAVAVHRARHGPAAPTSRPTVLTVTVTAGLLALLLPVAAGALRLDAVTVLLLGVLTVAVVAAGRWLGELQGDQRFVRLAAGMALLAAGRYGGVVAGLLVGAGLTGSLVAGAVTSVVVLPALVRLARPETQVARSGTPSARPETRVARSGTPSARPGTRVSAGTGPSADGDGGPGVEKDAPALTARAVLTASGATLAMLVVSYADLLLARRFLPVDASGAYAVGTVLTKGALWAPQVVTVIALPRLARGDRRTLAAALAAVGGCGAALVLAAMLAGGLAFRLAGGPDYTGHGRYAPIFAATGALYAMVFVLVNARIAAAARWPSAPLWISTVLFVLAVWTVVPHTVAGVAWTAMVTAGATALVTGLLTLVETEKSTKACAVSGRLAATVGQDGHGRLPGG